MRGEHTSGTLVPEHRVPRLGPMAWICHVPDAQGCRHLFSHRGHRRASPEGYAGIPRYCSHKSAEREHPRKRKEPNQRHFWWAIPSWQYDQDTEPQKTERAAWDQGPNPDVMGLSPLRWCLGPEPWPLSISWASSTAWRQLGAGRGSFTRTFPRQLPGKKNSEQQVTLCPLSGFTNCVCVILLGTTILKASNSTDRLAPLKTKALFERGRTYTPRFVLFCFDRSFEFQIPQIPMDYAGLPDTPPHPSYPMS